MDSATDLVYTVSNAVGPISSRYANAGIFRRIQFGGGGGGGSFQNEYGILYTCTLLTLVSMPHSSTRPTYPVWVRWVMRN